MVSVSHSDRVKDLNSKKNCGGNDINNKIGHYSRSPTQNGGISRGISAESSTETKPWNFRGISTGNSTEPKPWNFHKKVPQRLNRGIKTVEFPQKVPQRQMREISRGIFTETFCGFSPGCGGHLSG